MELPSSLRTNGTRIEMGTAQNWRLPSLKAEAITREVHTRIHGLSAHSLARVLIKDLKNEIFGFDDRILII